MLPDKSTPPQAQTDLPLGRARIPANWALELVLFLATCVCVQLASSHSLTQGECGYMWSGLLSLPCCGRASCIEWTPLRRVLLCEP